jgi:hypothetical protein
MTSTRGVMLISLITSSALSLTSKDMGLSLGAAHVSAQPRHGV